ncbi:MAG: hypothetical protein AB7G06_01815 [Bdellovibrionales bacterium]
MNAADRAHRLEAEAATDRGQKRIRLKKTVKEKAIPILSANAEARNKRVRRKRHAENCVDTAFDRLTDENDMKGIATRFASSLQKNLAAAGPAEFWQQVGPMIKRLCGPYQDDGDFSLMVWSVIIQSGNTTSLLAREPLLGHINICLMSESAALRASACAALWRVYEKIDNEVLNEHARTMPASARVTVGDLTGILRAVVKADTNANVQAAAQETLNRINKASGQQQVHTRHTLRSLRRRRSALGVAPVTRMRALEEHRLRLAKEAFTDPGLGRHVHIVARAQERRLKR